MFALSGADAAQSDELIQESHSQFSDIYQEEHSINYLTLDNRIVRELPKDNLWTWRQLVLL